MEIDFVELGDQTRVPKSDQFGCRLAEQAQRIDFDDDFREKTKSLIPDGGFVIDCGACMGMYTKIFSDLVGPLGLVLAYEPNQENLFFLTHNVSKFPVQNTFVRNAALGSARGFGNSTYKPTNVGESIVEMKYDDERYPVEFTTLDYSVREITTRRVNFIKVDVEGWEFFLLVGGWNLILKDKPVIYIEVNKPALARLGCTTKLLWNTLTELGYDFGMFQEKDIPEDGIYDLVCRPRD